MAFEDPTVIGWRAYFSGSRVFDSSSTAWELLPSTECLVVVVYEKGEFNEGQGLHYRRILKSADWYFCDSISGDIEIGDMADPVFSGTHHPDPGTEQHISVRGDQVTDAEFDAVVESAQSEKMAP